MGSDYNFDGDWRTVEFVQAPNEPDPHWQDYPPGEPDPED